MKVNKLDFYVILLWLALFQVYLPDERIYYIYQFVIASLIFIEFFVEILKSPKYLLFFLYPLTIIISCIVNKNTILYTQVARGCVSALLIVDVYLMIKRYERRRGAENLISILYSMSKLYVIISILWMIILIITGKLQNAVSEEFLFLRGKFPTAYMFIFYLMFFCLAWKGNRAFPRKWKKKIFIVQTIGCIGLCALIEISTGIVALLLVLVLTLWGKKVVRGMRNPFVVVGLIIGSMFLIFGLGAILQIPIVQNIIVKVLHEDLSLTGRMQLYTLLYPLILKSGLWGGGFGSYVASTLAYHGWYNAQNGLAEIILTYGFVGGITFLTLVFLSVSTAKNRNTIFYLIILVFIVISVIEVPFNNGFIFLLSLLQVKYDKEIDFVKEVKG